jgi:hypothetical protein
MNKQWWIKKNQDLVNLILDYNTMSIEDFKEEISTWERHDVGKKLR